MRFRLNKAYRCLLREACWVGLARAGGLHIEHTHIVPTVAAGVVLAWRACRCCPLSSQHVLYAASAFISVTPTPFKALQSPKFQISATIKQCLHVHRPSAPSKLWLVVSDSLSVTTKCPLGLVNPPPSKGVRGSHHCTSPVGHPCQLASLKRKLTKPTSLKENKLCAFLFCFYSIL